MMQRSIHSLRFLALTVLIPFTSAGLMAQGLEKSIEQFSSGTAVKGYIQPVADFFGANINSGWYHSAEIPTVGIHVELGLVGMGTMVGDESKTFDEVLPAGYSAATFRAPTLFGPKEGAVYTDPATGLTYGGSGGIFNTPIFPFGVPQLTVGSVYGTEAVVRFIGTPEIGDGKFPRTTLFGLGVRHNVSQYLPMVPVDLAGGFLYNSFSVGDLISFKSIAIGAQVSKSYAIFTAFGGLQWEHSTLSLAYTPSQAGSPPVSIDLAGANSFRATAGLGLSLGFLKLFADANFGSVTTFSGGLGFGL